MTNIEKRYYRSISVAEFIAEGHTIDETKEEFEISKDTIRRDLNFLADYGYGKENKRNLLLYQKAKKQLELNQGNRKKQA